MSYTTDLEEERREHENALEELRQRLEAAARQEIQGIIGQHGSEVVALQDSIASKTSELESVRLELETVRLAMSERDKGLGSATEQVEKLRVELGRSQEELRRRERAWEESRKENTELKVRSPAVCVYMYMSVCYVYTYVCVYVCVHICRHVLYKTRGLLFRLFQLGGTCS